MKIKLLQDLPVEAKHGMTKGRELDVIRLDDRKSRGTVRWWVMGDAGVAIGVRRRDAARASEGM